MPEQDHLSSGVDEGMARWSPSTASTVDPGVLSTSRGAEPDMPPYRGEEGLSTHHGSILDGRVDWPRSGVVVVHLAGELDLATAPRASELIRPRLSAAGVRTLVLDLSELSFIGSAGLSVLVHTQIQARAMNIALRLITGSQCVDRVLEITGLRSDFVCVPDLQSALR